MYLAPCVLRGQYSDKVDVWSVGCIAFQLLHGNPPFQGSTSFMELYNNILNGRWKFPDETVGSNLFRDFVTKCLEIHPENRLSASEALDHPFFTNSTPSSNRVSGAFVVFTSDTGELSWDPLQAFDDSGLDLPNISAQSDSYSVQERLRLLLH